MIIIILAPRQLLPLKDLAHLLDNPLLFAMASGHWLDVMPVARKANALSREIEKY
jgi:hypothetical protein